MLAFQLKKGNEKNMQELLGELITGQIKQPVDIVALYGERELTYTKLNLVPCCSVVEVDPDGSTSKITFVMRGSEGAGPFIFIWPPENVKTDQPACLGMPFLRISTI